MMAALTPVPDRALLRALNQHVFASLSGSSRTDWGDAVSHWSFDLNFLMIDGVKHFSKYLCVICVSSFEKYLFMGAAHLLIFSPFQ